MFDGAGGLTFKIEARREGMMHQRDKDVEISSSDLGCFFSKKWSEKPVKNFEHSFVRRAPVKWIAAALFTLPRSPMFCCLFRAVHHRVIPCKRFESMTAVKI